MFKKNKPIALSLLVAIISAIISIYVISEGYSLFISVLTLSSVIFTSIMAFFNWRGLQAAEAKMQELKVERRKSGLIETLKNRCSYLEKYDDLSQEFRDAIIALLKELFLLDESLKQTHTNDMSEIYTSSKDVVVERLRIILEGAKQ